MVPGSQWSCGRAHEKRTQAEILPTSDVSTTGIGAGALTVAGQWRSFTAFPSILAIADEVKLLLEPSSRYAMKLLSMT